MHYDKGYLSKIENGLKRPGQLLVRACDAALAAGGALADCAVLESEPGPSAPGPAGGVAEAWQVSGDPRRSRISATVPDRQADHVPVFTMDLRAPRAAAELDLAPYRAMLALYRQNGQADSPAELIPVLWLQGNLLLDRAKRSPAAQRAQILDLVIHFWHYSGWLAHEAGNEPAAWWFTDQAEQIARHTGNADMESYSLVRRALITLYLEDGKTTVSLALQAQAGIALSPRVRGLAAQREAQGHALNGDYSDCLKALDKAAECFAAANDMTGDAPVIGSSNVTDLAEATTGWCLVDLAHPLRATEFLGRTLERIPQTARRSHSRYLARQALAYADAGELETACASAQALLDLAGGLDSATIRMDLRKLRRVLTRGPGHPPVRELLPRIAQAFFMPGAP